MCLLPRKVRVTSSCNLSPPWDSCCGSHKCYSLDHLREFLVPHATYGGYVILLSTLDAICHFLTSLLVTLVLKNAISFNFLALVLQSFPWVGDMLDPLKEHALYCVVVTIT